MDKTFVGSKTAGLDVYPRFEPYSKVILWVDEETAYIAGDDSGRTLEAALPWGTQQIANDILGSITGFSYQPLNGTDALIDPAAELGDGITIGGVYGPIASFNTVFGDLFTSDVSAPNEEEVDHEYPYVDPETRELRRKVTLGRSYYGTRITRNNGLEIIKTEPDGTERSRAILNSDVQAFYNDNGQEALYFDINAGKFRFRGDVDITGGTMNVNNNFIVDADGNLTINGNINLSGGSITWGGNEPSSGISASEAKTIINSTLVSSPNIAGGKFLNLDQETWIEIGASDGYDGLVLTNDYYGGEGAFSVFIAGRSDSIILKGPNDYSFLIVDAYHGYTAPYGEWDFGSATVKGLSVVFG